MRQRLDDGVVEVRGNGRVFDSTHALHRGNLPLHVARVFELDLELLDHRIAKPLTQFGPNGFT